MAKKKGRHVRGRSGRVTPKGTQPVADGRHLHAVPTGSLVLDDDDDLDLMVDVRRSLGDRDPLSFLSLVSMLVEVASDRPSLDRKTPTMTLAELVDSFIDVDRAETTALLAAFGALLEGETGERARDARGGRRWHVPKWLDLIDHVTVGEVRTIGHVLDDGTNYAVDVHWPTGEVLTALVYIDTNMGHVVKDAFVVPDDAASVMRTYRRMIKADVPVGEMTFATIDPADARARLEEAIRVAERMYPPIETDTWPACRPIVEWIVRMLPAGGRGFERREWTDAERDELAARFFASEFGAPLAADEANRDAVDTILWYGTGYTGSDPLRWSAVRVEMFLIDFVPRKIDIAAVELACYPKVLGAFVRFAHDERGIPAALTAETLTAIDTGMPEFLDSIGRPRTFGAEAIARIAAGLSPFLDEDDEDDSDNVDDELDFDDDLWDDGSDLSDDETRRWYWGRRVGGEDVFATLDAEPLPDEPFAWVGIADDIVPVVAEVLELVDDCCDAVLDVEYRTICRRVLARAAVRSPKVFRRKARTDYAAGAILWLVGHGNAAFSWPHRQRMSAINEHLAIMTSTLCDRANTIRKAAGICLDDYHQSTHGARLADPTLLHSEFRARVLAYLDQPI